MNTLCNSLFTFVIALGLQFYYLKNNRVEAVRVCRVYRVYRVILGVELSGRIISENQRIKVVKRKRILSYFIKKLSVALPLFYFGLNR